MTDISIIINDMKRKVREIEKDIIKLENVYRRTSNSVFEHKEPILYRKVSQKAIMLASLLSIGGGGVAKEWKKEAKSYSNRFQTKQPDSSYPTKLTYQKLVRKEFIEGKYRYEINDFLDALSIIKRESEVFSHLKQRIKDQVNLQNKLFQNIVLNYSKKHRTFHIRDEFIRDMRISADEELTNLVENRLEGILKHLELKNTFSLTEGLNGILIMGRPIAIVTYHGAGGGG